MNPVLRIAGVVLAAVLAGCSPPPAENDEVATLETTGAAENTTVSSAAPAASRPRERLDMTPEEIDGLFASYDRCLAEHGGGKREVSAEEAAAEAACLGQKPLPPWEYDTANPESLDFVHRVVRCLRDNGVRYVEESAPESGEDRRGYALGGQDNDQESISKGLDLIPVCEKQEAGRR